MLITPEYAQLNRELHARGNYGVSGWKWATDVYSLARQSEAKTVLDYGSGQGGLFRTIRARFSEQPDGLKAIPLPFDCLEYDPAIEGKTEKPQHADLVVCGDVLEHVEPDCLYSVLDDIRSIARSAVFLVVATRLAQKTLSDGRNAHLIVERAEWWLPKIMDRWHIRYFRDAGGEFVCIGSTK